MKRTQGKTTAAAKRKSNKAPANDATADIPIGKHWRLTIGPGETTFIAENVSMCLMAIKNVGTEIVRLWAAYGDELDLLPGKFRVTDAWGKISLENPGEKPALVEMEFKPRIR